MKWPMLTIVGLVVMCASMQLEIFRLQKEVLNLQVAKSESDKAWISLIEADNTQKDRISELETRQYGHSHNNAGGGGRLTLSKDGALLCNGKPCEAGCAKPPCDSTTNVLHPDQWVMPYAIHK